MEEKGFGYQIGYELLTDAETEEQQRERVAKWLQEIRGSDDEAKGAAGKMLLEVLKEKGRKAKEQFGQWAPDAEKIIKEQREFRKKHRRG